MSQEGETFTIVDRWGDQWVCYTCVEDTDEFFYMYPPEDALHADPVAFCTKCKSPVGSGKLFQKHIVEKALFGKEIPKERKCGFLELQRRWMEEAKTELDNTRRKYAEATKMNEGKGKQLMLEMLKSDGEQLKADIAAYKQLIRKRLLHG